MCCMTGHEMGHGEHREGSAKGIDRADSLLDLLRRRYAQGEISRDQFQEMKRVLGLSASEAEAPPGHDAHAWEAA